MDNLESGQAACARARRLPVALATLLAAGRGIAAGGLAACALLAGCYTSAVGREPSADSLYYPTGLVVSPGRTTLYVANSDFDLQFSGGTVLALDAAALRAAVRPITEQLASGASLSSACAAAGLGLNGNEWLNPGPCAAQPVAPFVRSYAFVGAFASGLLLTHEPGGSRARLFAPVRGDPSITYFDVDDDRGAAPGADSTFRLDCRRKADGFCDDTHRLGQDRERTLRGIQLPADPVGIAASADGTAIVSAHQTGASVSLVTNPWDATPNLTYFLSNLPSGPTELVAIPPPAMVEPARLAATEAGEAFVYYDGFTLTFRAASEVDVLRYFRDDGAVPPRPFVYRTDAVPLATASSNFDSRGMAILDTERRACEASCGAPGAGTLGCLTACAEEIPLRVFIANRSPAMLLIGEITSVANTETLADGASFFSGVSEDIVIYDSLPLNFGPTTVTTGQVINAQGELEDRVFAVCFDSRMVFIVDPVLQRIDGIVSTGRNPHDVAVDTGQHADGTLYSYLYVGHFTDSYLGVVDLDVRHPLTYAQIFASVGIPTPPVESR